MAAPSSDATAGTGANPDGVERAVEGVRARRDRLREAMQRLDAVGAPPLGELERWYQKLRKAVDELAVTLGAHVSETEGPDGFFEQLMTETFGRLKGAIDGLRRDHERCQQLMRELSEQVDVEEPHPEALHAAARELLDQLDEHRRVGADLLWEAYGVDLGLQD
jgi:hypothetical protein